MIKTYLVPITEELIKAMEKGEAPYEYADELIRNADTVVEADKGE